MNPFKSYRLQTKSVTTRNRTTPLPQTRWTHDSYVLIMRLKKRVRLFEEGATMQPIYIQGVFATIKNYLLSLYCVRVLKPFCISHIKFWASVMKEPDSVVCEQQRCRPVCASGQSDACLCNLLPGKNIAKQLNLAH